MTRIIDGCAQPNVVGTKNGRKIYIFVETVNSFKENLGAIMTTLNRLCDDDEVEAIDEIRILFAEELNSFVLCGCGQKHMLFKGIDAPMYWCGDGLKSLKEGDEVECEDEE